MFFSSCNFLFTSLISSSASRITPWTSFLLFISYAHCLVNSIYVLITPKFLAWVSLLHYPSICLFDRQRQLNMLSSRKAFPHPSWWQSHPSFVQAKSIHLLWLLAFTNHILSLSKRCWLCLQDLSNHSHHCHHSHAGTNHHQIPPG